MDEITLLRAKKREEAACRALFRRYRDPVFALLWRMHGARATRTVVEDLTQETFLRVFAALPRFSVSGPARLSTWILTIATRVALNELRKHEPLETPLEQVSDRLAHDARTDSGTERRLLGDLIARELSRLAPEHRVVLLLREYHELKYQEIADALDVELGTVQSRLARARAALREALKEVGHVL